MQVYEEWMQFLVYYPGEDEEGYDGVHDGGIKGVSDNAPAEARKAFDNFMEDREKLKSHNTKI